MSIIIDGTGTISGVSATGLSSAQTITSVPSSALPTGSVLQVVNAVYGTYTTMGSTSYTDTGLTATITPKFANSKILVEVIHNGVGRNGTNSNNCAFFRLVKNGSTIYYIDEDVGYTGTSISQNVGSSAFSYLDNAGGTSPITYNTQFANAVASGTVWLNNYSINTGRTNSTITLWEIAG